MGKYVCVFFLKFAKFFWCSLKCVFFNVSWSFQLFKSFSDGFLGVFG